MVNAKALLCPAANLFFGIFVFVIPACTLNVEKIEKYGVNDQQYEYGPTIGNWGEQDTIFRFCCNGTISTHKSEFDKGRYEVIILAKGTQAYRVYPLIRILLNNKALGEIRLDSNLTTYRLPFLLEEKKIISVQVSFDQDVLDDKGNDRDVLIRRIAVSPISNP